MGFMFALGFVAGVGCNMSMYIIIRQQLEGNNEISNSREEPCSNSE